MSWLKLVAICIFAAVFLSSDCCNVGGARSSSKFSLPHLPSDALATLTAKKVWGKHEFNEQRIRSWDTIADLRGGASRSKTRSRRSTSASLHSSKRGKTATGKTKVGARKENTSALSDTMKKYKSILPLTRVYISMVGMCTVLAMILGEEASQAVMALDPIRTFSGWELWRILTAATFLGPPSVGWLMSGYYLFEYGSNLERAYGTAQYFVFLCSQVAFLCVLSTLFGLPFFGSSVITSMLHVLSRTMPTQKVKWLIFTVPYWSLPLGLMATDVLQAGSAMAALPHVLGILSGHFYFFHKFIWPKLGGEDWLDAPEFLRNLFDRDARDLAAAAKKKVTRKKGSGRRLGR